MKVVDINQVALGAELDPEDLVLVGGWPSQEIHPLPVKYLLETLAENGMNHVTAEAAMLVYTNKWEQAGPMPISQNVASTLITRACERAVRSGYSPNKNSLTGMACPKCLSFGPFEITVTTTAVVTDEGASVEGDIEYGPPNACKCRACQHNGTVQTFTLPHVATTPASTSVNP